MNKKGNSAVSFFHATPNNYNCAQSIIKNYQDKIRISDEDIELKYRSKGGGRAEDGLCGAVYSAYQILDKDKGDRIKAKVETALGGYTCRKLKAELKVPCTKIVELVDVLIKSEI